MSAPFTIRSSFLLSVYVRGKADIVEKMPTSWCGSKRRSPPGQTSAGAIKGGRGPPQWGLWGLVARAATRASHSAGLKTAQHAAAVAKKAARATAEQVHAVLNSPPQQQAPLARSPPTATLREAAAFGRGLAGPS